MEPRNRFQGMNSPSLCSLASRYDSPIPPRLLAPINSLEIPAQVLSKEEGGIREDEAMKLTELLFLKDARDFANYIVLV